MSKISQADYRTLEALSRLAYCNPFSTDRIDAEKEVLGSEFRTDEGIAWSRGLQDDPEDGDRPNVIQITAIANGLVRKFRDTTEGENFGEEVLSQYWDVVTYVLLYQHIVGNSRDELLLPKTAARVWKSFHADYQQLCDLPGLSSVGIQPPDHLFACLCQVHRAFIHIYGFILGDSLPTVKLRRAVWESIFTNDLRRYRRVLYNRIGDLPTLVTGPSGTGKELVARAIAMSQYIPFDQQTTRFIDASEKRFHALNLSAMSATLIESELFGHRKGSFTGAIEDRTGWLEQCKPHGAIFLDEIGELDPGLQVKLLRVVQQRTYLKLGESVERKFAGKLIGATNRDLTLEMREGRFREDLYYRLCADRVHTPSLRSQLDDCPDDLIALTWYIARRLVGEEAGLVSGQAIAWINENLESDYPWRGNILELEQCVCSILIRGEYTPSQTLEDRHRSAQPSWLAEIGSGKLDAEAVLKRYCTWVYFRTGSYEAAARQTGLDRRTVKARLDKTLLEKLKANPV